MEDMWTNPSGTLKGVGPGTELDWYVQQLRAGHPGVVKVDLCKQMLGPEGAREIMEALENSTTARSVLLGADEIGPEGARAVGQSLLKNRSLKTVFLGCNGIGEVGARHIAEAIEQNDVVEGYWLKRNHIGLPGLQAILHALRSNHSVKTLDLVQNELGVDGARILEAAFCDPAHPLPITSLFLSGNHFGVEGAVHIAGIIRNNATLQHLYLGLNDFGEEGGRLIALALPHNSTLRTLAVLSNSLGPQAAAAFAEALRHNSTLESLDLGYAKATKVLDGHPNMLGDDGLIALAPALNENTSLRILNLTRNGIGEAGYLALARALRQTTPLTSLTLDHNRVPTVAALRALLEALPADRATGLTRLTLPHCPRGSEEYGLVGQIRTRVGHNRTAATAAPLPADEQRRLREFSDIKSDYRLPLPKSLSSTSSSSTSSSSVKRRVRSDEKRKRIRKLKKKLRTLEADEAHADSRLAVEMQLVALTPSPGEVEVATVHRRLAQIQKLETMLQDGVKLRPEELNKIQRKDEFLLRLQAINA